MRTGTPTSGNSGRIQKKSNTILTQFGEAEVIAEWSDGSGRPVVRDGVKLFAKHLKKRTADDFQSVIVVDGRTGTGKSNFAIALALAIDPKWRIEENYVYDVSDLRRKLSDPHAHPVTLMDEGSIILNSLNSMRGDDKEIVTLFDTMRTRHMITIVCCPSYFKLNKTFRQSHVDYRCLCPSRSPIGGYRARGFVHIHSHHTSEWKDKDSFPLVYTAVFSKMDKATRRTYDNFKAKSQKRIMDKFIAREDD